MENPVVTQISEIREDAEGPTSDKWAEAGLVIRKLLPRHFGDDALDSRLTIPNPAGLSCSDAIMYAMDALQEYKRLAIDALNSEIDKHRGDLSGLAGEYKDDWCDGDWIHLNQIQRAGVLIYIIQKGLHNISDEEELLKRFRMGIVIRVGVELKKIYCNMCEREKSSEPSTLAARRVVRVPRANHGGQSRNPAKRLGAAESPPSDILAEAGLVIRKLLPYEILNYLHWNCLNIPNPDGLSCYDAIMYAINALSEESALAMDRFRSIVEMDTNKTYLSRQLAGEWLRCSEGNYNINRMQRAAILLYLLQEGLYDISKGKELLKRIRRGVVSDITEYLERCYFVHLRRQFPEQATPCAA